jgi:chromosome segregation ATPase
MVALAAILEEIGSLDQVAKESKSAAEAAKAEAKKAKDEAKKAGDKLDEVLQKSAAIEADANVRAGLVVRQAEELAAELERAGQEKAAAAITAAQMEASAISSGNAMQVAQARAEVDQFNSVREQLQKDISAKSKELADLESAIAKTKSKLAALIA